MEGQEPKERGKLYYLQANLREWMRTRWNALVQSRSFKVISVLLILLAFGSRAYLQPYFLVVREYSFVFVLLLLLVGLGLVFRVAKVRRAIVVPVMLGMFALCVAFVIVGAQRYVALYLKYENLNRVELNTLPLSDLVTPQPLNSVHVLAQQKTNESENVAIPDRVYLNGDVRWVMEKSPAFLAGRLFGHIEQIFNLSATAPSPSFAALESVDFPTGEGLALGRNVFNAVIKGLGPFKFFNSFPTDVKYLRDDSGEWVQVVSLARWDGILFPSLEFGGVVILRQHKDEGMLEGFWSGAKRLVIGEGEWIAPENISKYAYLKGQNLVPYIVHRTIADSFRFRAGFLGPMPGLTHQGDIRIPDLAEDLNPQPFVSYFREVDNTDGLFAYFGLEPWLKTRRGLSVSLFIPGDGHDGAVYVYDHQAKNERLTGTTAMASKVIDSRKNYDWSKARPVEHRAYIRDIAGKRRLYFLTTVAVIDADGNMAGSTPDLVITDANYDIPVWVDVTKGIDAWDAQLTRDMDGSYNKEKKD